MSRMRRLFLLAVVAPALAVGLVSADAAERADYAAVALTVLPPGQNGSLSFDRHTNDQVALYDCLTPLFDRVTARDLRRCFKPATLGLDGKPERVERPRRGVVIERDAWGVPHVEGKTQEDVAFGAGWATAEDRGVLLELIRGPARAAALDLPGLDPLSLALSGRSFVPSPEAEARLAEQVARLRTAGAIGRSVLRISQAYVDGINAFYTARGLPVAPYTVNDVIAAAALIAARFGSNGGSEVARSMFLDALQRALGAERGRAVFRDLSEANDPEAPVSVPGRFPQLPSPGRVGGVVLDDGSFQAAAQTAPAPSLRSRAASNAVLVGAKRSKTGHPLFVAGPQVGFFFPAFFMEIDLHGGGFDVRGALFPGVPFVLIGRGPDFAWSATSSQADTIDVFAETLCGDDAHYLYKGSCRAMTTFSAGVLRSPGRSDQPLRVRETVHGPVFGYATTGGRRVALALARTNRGREILSARAFYRLNTGQVASAQGFLRTMGLVDFAFNFFYADDRDIAFFSAGRIARRAAGADPQLPLVGTGEHDWPGFLPFAGHAQAINPPGGAIVNWNNKPAAGVALSDQNWSYGSVQRVQLLTAALGSGKQDLAAVVAATNKAATQDLRVMRLWPTIAAVLATGPAPSPLAQQMASLLDAWRASGGSRLDRDLDGLVDHPGAAIMDAAWPRLADAVLAPVLGPLLPRLAELHERSDDANPQGSAYLSGWYGYVDKDLRALLGRPVRGPFQVRYCGAGDLGACRASLWAALQAAGEELAARQGPDPSAWRASATKERIDFATGILKDTMRWANRPTFQQVMAFSGHRPR